MTAKSAIEWHTAIAVDFNANYHRRANFQERLAVFSELIRTYSSSRKRVIDLGCGGGVFSLYAAQFNAHVTGIDGSDAMISIGKRELEARELKNVDFAVKDITALTSADVTTADLIICSSVLEYLDDLPGAIAVIERLLNAGGTLIVSMPNRSSIYRKLEKIAFRLLGRPKYYQFVKHVVTADDMISLLEKKNLVTRRICYFSGAPVLSSLFPAGFKRWTDNMFVIAAIKDSQ
jgi:2-polyprenyl-6-hydroxyphenyl methylase/3-demethylubiquinone-9 3-methyltransferase